VPRAATGAPGRLSIGPVHAGVSEYVVLSQQSRSRVVLYTQK
jgi:hypothetical protein